jgi:hypothetical protein
MIDPPFGNAIVSDSCPEGTILSLPRITLTHHFNVTTGEMTDVYEWNPKEAGIITNVKP